MKEAKTKSEAFDMIFGGFIYFLKNYTKITVIATMLIAGGDLYIVIDYFKSDKINVEKLKPLSSEFNLFPNLYAQGQYKIEFNGKYYGEYDPNYVVFKIKNKNEIIVFNKYLETGFRYEIPALDDFKKIQRSK